MYHAFVRGTDGRWRSFGLHAPSEWTSRCDELRRIYGTDNVCYLFWQPVGKLGSVGDTNDLILKDLKLVLRVQALWDAGDRSSAREDGSLHVARAVARLRQAQRAS